MLNFLEQQSELATTNPLRSLPKEPSIEQPPNHRSPKFAFDPFSEVKPARKSEIERLPSSSYHNAAFSNTVDEVARERSISNQGIGTSIPNNTNSGQGTVTNRKGMPDTIVSRAAASVTFFTEASNVNSNFTATRNMEAISFNQIQRKPATSHFTSSAHGPAKPTLSRQEQEVVFNALYYDSMLRRKRRLEGVQ